jgi:hypothetical protein
MAIRGFTLPVLVMWWLPIAFTHARVGGHDPESSCVDASKEFYNESHCSTVDIKVR